jgi:hypothetical protein
MGVSRREFGKLIGLQALAAPALILAAGAPGEAAAQAATGALPHIDPQAPLRRGAFVALLARHFDWVHSSEYADAYKGVQPTFADVKLGDTPYAREIEVALEAGVLGNSEPFFHPAQPMTRTDAAAILGLAFDLPAAEVVALAGREGGKALTGAEGQALLGRILAARVSPPQALCKPGTTAPRRYVRLHTPTEGATIRYTVTFDGSEPADPSGEAGQVYDFRSDGVLMFVNPLNSATDARLYRLKCVAGKPGLAPSAVRYYEWYIIRPKVGVFEAKLEHPGSATTPRVYKIHNPAEYFQANVYYIEGSTRGLVFDSGEYSHTKGSVKPLIDSLATKPYDVVLGHIHPDHSEQIYNFTSAGVTLYVAEQEKAALVASNREDFQSAGKAAIAVAGGHVLDLGNVQVSVWPIPGHTHGLATILVNQTGQVYGSDMWGCNRPHTADTTQYQAVKVDLFLSLVLQLIADYERTSTSGHISSVTNAHQETPVGMQCVRNFVQCFQQLIDEGNAAAQPSIRGGTKGGDRMSLVGDMWRDRNWMAIGPIGKYAAPVDYLTAPTRDYPCNASIDYNQPGGHLKYSVLSHIGIAGGRLVGVDLHWAAPANGAVNRQAGKFDPWTYDYVIQVPAGARSITLTPRAMSNKVQSMRLDGQAIAQSSSREVAIVAGQRIVLEITSPDASATSRYAFTVAVA